MPHRGRAGAWQPTALSTQTRGSASAMWGRGSEQVSARGAHGLGARDQRPAGTVTA